MKTQEIRRNPYGLSALTDFSSGYLRTVTGKKCRNQQFVIFNTTICKKRIWTTCGYCLDNHLRFHNPTEL